MCVCVCVCVCVHARTHRAGGETGIMGLHVPVSENFWGRKPKSNMGKIQK